MFSPTRHLVPVPDKLEFISQDRGPSFTAHLQKPGQCSAWLSQHFLGCSQSQERRETPGEASSPVSGSLLCGSLGPSSAADVMESTGVLGKANLAELPP